MPTRKICPDKVFGRGCDFAKIYEERRLAELFEIKSCTLGLDDVSDAIDELSNTITDLKGSDSRYQGYSFKLALVHEKHSSCKVISQAAVLLEAKRVQLGNWQRSEFAEIFREFKELCSDS